MVEDNTPEKVRIAVLTSHPIQYQAPLHRLIASQPDIDIHVFFRSNISVGKYMDKEFGKEIAWDVPILEGYSYSFLPAIGKIDQWDVWRPWNYGLKSRLRAGGYDVLWINQYANWFSILSMFTGRSLGLKVLLRDEPNLISRPRSKLKRALKSIFFRIVDQAVDKYLAIGTLNKEYYLAHGIAEDKIHTLGYSVDNQFFEGNHEDGKGAAQSLAKSLGLSPGRPVVLYASKLTRRKRADDLLTSFVHASARMPEHRKPYLLFVGSGEVEPILRETVDKQSLGDDVRLLGFRNQSELPAFYRMADIFVLPSEFETWGLVVNEAMNGRCAIIASNSVGSAYDLVKGGENGFMFDVGDLKQLENALYDSMEDPERMAEMGNKSFEIIENWGFEQNLKELKNCCRSLKLLRE